MKSLSAPCDKAGFLPFRFAPRGLVSSLRLSAPLVFSSPPLGEITERESRLRKAFFRTLLEFSIGGSLNPLTRTCSPKGGVFALVTWCFREAELSVRHRWTERVTLSPASPVLNFSTGHRGLQHRRPLLAGASMFSLACPACPPGWLWMLDRCANTRFILSSELPGCRVSTDVA